MLANEANCPKTKEKTDQIHAIATFPFNILPKKINYELCQVSGILFGHECHALLNLQTYSSIMHMTIERKNVLTVHKQILTVLRFVV